MSVQELVDELRAWGDWLAQEVAENIDVASRAADRIEAQAKEINRLRHFVDRGEAALTERAERAEQESAELAAVIAEALAIHKPHQVATSGSTIPELPNSFEQRCNWCDTPWPCRTARALSAAPADALSAYTTRIREEAVEWEYGIACEAFGDEPNPHPTLEAAEHVRDNATTLYRKWTHGNPVTIYRRRAAGPWSEIPEGQTS